MHRFQFQSYMKVERWALKNNSEVCLLSQEGRCFEAVFSIVFNML